MRGLKSYYFMENLSELGISVLSHSAIDRSTELLTIVKPSQTFLLTLPSTTPMLILNGLV